MRILTLFTVLTICASAFGQAFSIFDPAMQAPPVASGATCETLVDSQTGAYDSATSLATAANNQYAWFRITNASAATICGLEISLRKNTAPDWNITFAIYTTSDGTNVVSQVGGDSDALATASMSTSFTTNAVSWSSNRPALEAGTYLLVIKNASYGSGSVSFAAHAPLTVGKIMLGSSSFTISAYANRRPYFRLLAQ